jgi:hypothetical protein
LNSQLADATARNDQFAVNSIKNTLATFEARLSSARAELQTLNVESVEREQLPGRRNLGAGPSQNALNQNAILATEAARRASAAASAEASRKVTAAMQEELRVMKLTNLEREIETRLREAKVSANSREGAEIRRLVTEKYNQQAANSAVSNSSGGAGQASQSLTERLAALRAEYEAGRISLQQYNQGMQQVQGNMGQLGQASMNVGQQLAGALTNAIVNGESLKKTLANLAKQLATMLLNQAFSSLFGSMGGAGGLFGFADGGVMSAAGPRQFPVEAFAAGGIANRPMISLFGEAKRPEAYVPLPDGRNIPVKLRGGSERPSNQLSITYNIPAGVSRAELQDALQQHGAVQMSQIQQAFARGKM